MNFLIVVGDVIFSGDPEDSESNFAEHKRNVIKNSIMYNLALSMVTYSQMSRLSEYDLPIISEEEWDSILTNVSMVTFMQGLSCGLKYYNNYAIATSTNNEITVTPSEIYYVPVEVQAQYDSNDGYIYTDLTDDYSTNETAHRIDCDELDSVYSLNGEEKSVEYYVSFKSKDIKYDKIYDSTLGIYTYDHKSYLDYSCIINGNYWGRDSTTATILYRGNFDLEDNLYILGNSNKLKAYRIAVAKERNNLYKSLEYETNYGWEIAYMNETGKTVDNSTSLGSLSISEDASNIYKIAVTYSNTNIDTNDNAVNMGITLNGTSSENKTVITESSSTTDSSVEFSIHGASGSISSIDFSFTSTSSGSSVDASVTVKSIKVYYK